MKGIVACESIWDSRRIQTPQKSRNTVAKRSMPPRGQRRPGTISCGKAGKRLPSPTRTWLIGWSANSRHNSAGLLALSRLDREMCGPEIVQGLLMGLQGLFKKPEQAFGLLGGVPAPA